MKKSVGLITMHRVANHGSVLQTLATQKAIEQLGYNCTIIDYAYPTDEHLKRIGLDWYPHERDLWQLVKKTIRHRPIAETYRRLEHFYWFRKKYLKTTNDTYCSNEELKQGAKKMPFDIYCVGSDQVWNPTYTMGDGAFVLDFVPDGKRKISYSSSFVVNEIASEEQKQFYGNHLKNFDEISVRERSGVDLVKELTGKTATHVLDPVFLLTKEQWMKLLRIKENKKKSYLLFYSLNYMANTMPEMIKFVEHVMDERNQSGKIVSNKVIKCRYEVDVVNDDRTKAFVERIANASMLITDSFHASAFAMIFGVPVLGFSGNINDDRLNSLYQMMGVPERFMKKESIEGTIISKTMDGTVQKIAELRHLSMLYLRNALE